MPPVRENGVVILADNGGEDKDGQLPTVENKPMILANAGGSVHGEHSLEEALIASSCHSELRRGEA
jgi:hypothetical protein